MTDKIIAALIAPLLLSPIASKANPPASEGSFYQIKMGAISMQAGNENDIVPALSIGKRFEMEDSAVEITTAWGEHYHRPGQKSTFFSLPRVIYLNFYEPSHQHSLFYGAGLSWSRTRIRNDFQDYDARFNGIHGEGVVGYELKRTSRFRSIAELNVSQPMLAYHREGKHPGPNVFLNVSLGFPLR